VRVPPDPYLRFDTNDYSLDPSVVERRVKGRATQREITAVVPDTDELACGHQRSFAEHRTITALEHAGGCGSAAASATTSSSTSAHSSATTS
jgi:hypothetical protein